MPPLTIFIIGIGKPTFPLETNSNNSLLAALAAAFKQASETAKVALAPKLVLNSVPSNFNKVASISF